ncbi:hypothetical protein LAM21_21320, partial [Mycobacterium tuberculosis]|nr:hypothetical protein [Mycobacterium tuberculosis]
LYPRPGKRSAAGQDIPGAIPAFVPDGAMLIRPTASSRKLLYRRPGKRSAAGQDTSGAIPAFVPDGGFALSGLREPPVSPYTPGLASAAPPGRTPQTPYPPLCRMAASPYPAYGILP